MEQEAAHGAAAHESSGFPPFDQVDTFASQIFWLVVCFAILYLAATYWVIPKVRKTIVDRESAIAKDVAEAAAASQKADAAARALEARIAEAKARSRDTAAKARSAADATIAAETTKIEAKLGADLAKAEANLAAVRAAAMANVPAVAEEATAAITLQLAGLRPDAAAVKRAVGAALVKG